MTSGVSAVSSAVMPNNAALAFVPAAELLEPAASAMDCPVACFRSQLHPAGLIGKTAPDAIE